MPPEDQKNSKGTCFVVMGFGKKTDFETQRTLDLDKSYTYLIKPAVEEAGLKCIRADEIVNSGLIDVPMYEQLLNADVVIADLSTSNKNTFYELGVRHALRPFTTVVICEDSIKSYPFDVNHVVVRTYHHLGEDIGITEVMRFGKLLTKAIKEIVNRKPPIQDSPVYTILKNLTPPVLAPALAINASNNSSNVVESVEELSHSFMMQKVDDAQHWGNWLEAKRILKNIRQKKKQTNNQQEDPYILQRLVLVTYKSESPTQMEALKEAHELLQLLDPQTSNDPETLGLCGAINKRLYKGNKNRVFLEEAIRAYQRGYYLRGDYYNGINYAFMLDIRAAHAVDQLEATADFVQAHRIRKEVIAICEKWLDDNPKSNDQAKEIPDFKNPKPVREYLNPRYWVLSTLREAYIGLRDERKAEQLLVIANMEHPEDWMKHTCDEQIKMMRKVLQKSPLKYR